jgi:hypothetical protein
MRVRGARAGRPAVRIAVLGGEQAPDDPVRRDQVADHLHGPEPKAPVGVRTSVGGQEFAGEKMWGELASAFG